jgi:hypothetical protein
MVELVIIVNNHYICKCMVVVKFDINDTVEYFDNFIYYMKLYFEHVSSLYSESSLVARYFILDIDGWVMSGSPNDNNIKEIMEYNGNNFFNTFLDLKYNKHSISCRTDIITEEWIKKPCHLNSTIFTRKPIGPMELGYTDLPTYHAYMLVFDFKYVVEVHYNKNTKTPFVWWPGVMIHAF